MSSVTLSESSNNENDRLVAENIVKWYKNHPRVQLTAIKMTLPWNIFIQPASDQLRSLKEFESKESHWPSYYESYKISSNIIDFHLANIINNDLSKNFVFKLWMLFENLWKMFMWTTPNICYQ